MLGGCGVLVKIHKSSFDKIKHNKKKKLKFYGYMYNQENIRVDFFFKTRKKGQSNITFTSY